MSSAITIGATEKSGKIIRRWFTPAYVNSGMKIVHVVDVAQGHLLAARNGRVGRHYVPGCENMSLFSSQRAIDELGYQPGPAITALQDAVNWFNENGYL